MDVVNQETKPIMDKMDLLKIGMALQGIALSCPKSTLGRIQDYLTEIEQIVGKYAPEGGDT